MHQRTKKCQQFRTIHLFVENVLLQYLDTIIYYFMLRTAMEQLHFCTRNRKIELKLQTIIKNMTTIKIFLEKGLNGKTVYIFNYEKVC